MTYDFRKQEADLIIKKLANHGIEALWAPNKGGGFCFE